MFNCQQLRELQYVSISQWCHQFSIPASLNSCKEYCTSKYKFLYIVTNLGLHHVHMHCVTVRVYCIICAFMCAHVSYGMCMRVGLCLCVHAMLRDEKPCILFIIIIHTLILWFILDLIRCNMLSLHSEVGSNRVLRGPLIQVVGVALIAEFCDYNYSFVF